MRLLLVLRCIVQFDCLAELFADPHAHVGAVIEVTQVAQRVIALGHGVENEPGAGWTDWIGRDVDFEEDLVVLEQLSQIGSEVIVQLVAVEVELGEEHVVLQRLDHVVAHSPRKCII